MSIKKLFCLSQRKSAVLNDEEGTRQKGKQCRSLLLLTRYYQLSEDKLFM